jgi:hypothetical protein
MMVQSYIDPALAITEYVANAFAHTVSGPLTVGAGGIGFMMTGNDCGGPAHPNVLVSTTSSDPIPALPQFTIILSVPCPTMIIPPTISQVYVFPAGVTE